MKSIDAVDEIDYRKRFYRCTNCNTVNNAHEINSNNHQCKGCGHMGSFEYINKKSTPWGGLAWAVFQLLATLGSIAIFAWIILN